jgi:hypothetical protein
MASRDPLSHRCPGGPQRVQLHSTGCLSFCVSQKPSHAVVRASEEAMATEKLGIKVESNLPELRIYKLGADM